MRFLLPRDSHLFGDQVIHGHLLTEGAGGCHWAGHRALAFVREVNDGAVGDVEVGEAGTRIAHIGELTPVAWGICEKQIPIGGESLGSDRNP